jgi:hypothetical protein
LLAGGERRALVLADHTAVSQDVLHSDCGLQLNQG